MKKRFKIFVVDDNPTNIEVEVSAPEGDYTPATVTGNENALWVFQIILLIVHIIL